jgi:hypothetical protein
MKDRETKESDGPATPKVKARSSRKKKKSPVNGVKKKKRKKGEKKGETTAESAPIPKPKSRRGMVKRKQASRPRRRRSSRLVRNNDVDEDYDPSDESIDIEESEEMSEDDLDASDVDEAGNLKGFIDYDMPDQYDYIQVIPTRSKARTRRGKSQRRLLQSEPSIEIDFGEMMQRRRPSPPPLMLGNNNQDDQLTKMLVLNQLCAAVEKMDKRKRRRRKKRKSDENETSSSEEEDSDSSFHPDEGIEMEDLRDTFTPSERTYYKKLNRKKRRDCIEEYDTLRLLNSAAVPLKFRILGLTALSTNSKAFLMNRLMSFQGMETTDNEYHKLNTWFSNFQKLPLNEYTKFPISKAANSPKEIYKFLVDSRNTMNSAVYGHEHVKDEIIQLISGWISNEVGTGQVLALQGPPGNGKTTLVKNGLSKVLGRPFSLIALGGAKDSAFLQGHDYTFEGSKPGRMIEVIRDAGCMNPVIFFDEVDKLSDSPAGKEISNLLCHLLDPVQNSTFQDRYFSGIDIDLSKAVFVMSFNNPDKVDPILKDRMRVIRMDGFKTGDKIKIAKDYLLPEIFEEFKFKPRDLKIADGVVKHIVEKYTNEHGVRDLRRNLSTIVSRINVLKLVGKRSESKLKKVVKYTLPAKTKFPLVLSVEHADALLKHNAKSNVGVPGMYT